MIISRGLGILIPFIAGLILVGVTALTDALMHDDSYAKWHYWPKALGAVVAGVAIWFIGRYLNGRPGQVLIDKNTGHEVVRQTRHDIFFVKFELWGIIIVAFAVLGYFV